MLTAVMASRYGHSSRDVWQSRIRTGELLLNGTCLQNDVPVGSKDVVNGGDLHGLSLRFRIGGPSFTTMVMCW